MNGRADRPVSAPAAPGSDPRYENRAVAILALAGGVAGVDMLAINFLSPFVVADLHLSNAQIGMVGTAQLFAWSVGGIVVALLSDHHGRRKPFLVAGLAFFALTSGATAFASSFASLIAIRLLVGLAEGPVIPMQNAIILAVSSPHRRGLNIGLVQNFGSQLLGALAGPLLLVWIATHLGGWRNAFLIAGVPAVLMAAVVHFMIAEPPRDAVVSDAPRVPLWRTIAALLAVRNIRLCFLIGLFAIGWYATMLTFAPLWAIRVQHLSPAAMSAMMASIGGAGATGAILVPWLSDHVGRRPALALFALVGMGAPFALLSQIGSLPLLCLAIFGGGLFMGIFPLFIGVVPMESVEPGRGATALALVMGLAQIIGGTVGTTIAGLLADALSLAAPLWLACGFALCAAATALFLVETAPARIRL